MSSFFEPDTSLLFDPSSQMDEVPSSFLSFSSFAALANIASSPWSSSSPESDTHQNTSSKYNRRSSGYFLPSGSDASTPPSLSDEGDLFYTLEGACDPLTPDSPSYGLFHSPCPPQSSKLRTTSLQASATDIWNTPRTSTPTLLSKASIESVAEASSSSPSSSHTASSSRNVHASPLRTASNPVLGSTYRPKKIKQIASMPALNEEDSLPANIFDNLDIDSVLGLPLFGNSQKPVEFQEALQDDALVEDFGWVFSDYGLGASSSGSGSTIVPTDSTIFAAFHEQPSTSSCSVPMSTNSLFESTQDVDPAMMAFSESNQIFTIDPMEFMGSIAGGNGLNVSSELGGIPASLGEGSGSLMSIPMGEVMSRSCSSDDGASQRSALSQDPFSYVSQQVQPSFYSTVNALSYNLPQQQVVMPPSPTQPLRTLKASRPGLSVQIQPTGHSTYRIASTHTTLPPTPTSATFENMSSQQPLPIARNSRIPNNRSSVSSGSSMDSEIPMPPVVARAAAIVAMQEAKQQAQRQEYRRQAASRRVGMAEASVLQPYAMNARQEQITGWTGGAVPQVPAMQYSVTQPMVTVHPPPMTYSLLPTQSQPGPSHPSHRIHPPPHPGTASRPIARLPSTPTRARKVSASPSKRTPSRKRASPETAGGFSWGAATFINFTSDDAEKLLTGVAPSGSQAKRKREEEARAQEELTMGERKRSKSGEQ
ncbi:hypothetical protein BD324DRAFT_348944 [Kockovaella imperatae]|uniref:Developmental regulatory protein wetA n=1 Tax=Kockovaella imperatae TaxID=4999 RepID=A0A1Y1UJT7_9TREE|nr:hypothetical protein BD324DRAFT_348944 [Kockovaella imperatae]ORX38318.1 hypothetical protein BD324DRAFT_348944 [Kockovaella imperatae]